MMCQVYGNKAPADYFLFPCLKKHLKGQWFLDIANLQCNMNAKLNRIPQADFAQTMQDFYTCSQIA